jgi:hypothetical protein
MRARISRREFALVAASGLLGAVPWRPALDDGRLHASPRRPTETTMPGEHALGLATGRGSRQPAAW